VNPVNDESRPFERLTANITAENVARSMVGLRLRSHVTAGLLLLDETATPLQRSLRALRRTLADAGTMDEPSRIAFASIGARTFALRFGPELLIVEAEEITRRAARAC
jgi:hypothetical protein